MPTTLYAASEGKKFAADTTLVVVECPTCRMTYAIPESLKASAIRHPGTKPNGWKLTCPLGHQWWYVGESVEDKLRAEQERTARLRASLDQARARTQETEQRRIAQKAATTRARNQRDADREAVAAGKCPCCGRTFKHLERHMASQHPEFGPLGEYDGEEAPHA